MYRENLFFKKFKLGDAVSFFDKSSSVVHIRFDEWRLNEWRRQVGADPLESPDGDRDVFFDNIGRYIVKIYRVSSETSTRSNIFATGNC